MNTLLSIPLVLSLAQVSSTITLSQERGNFLAKIPVLAGRSPLVRMANSQLQSVERQGFTEFWKQAKRERIQEGPDGMRLRYGYRSETAVKMSHTRLISLVTSTYRYSGGAHGMTTTSTHNFGFVDGRPTRLSLWHILKSDKSFKDELKLRLLGKALAEPRTDWVQDGSFTGFTETQLQRFWIRPTGLVWEFDAYELGSYASGPFSFALTWEELRGLVRPKDPARDQ